MRNETGLTYSFFKKWKNLLIAGVSMGLLQLALTVIYKERGAKLMETLSDSELFFKKLVVDWLLVEALAVVVLFQLTFQMRAYIGQRYPRSFQDIVRLHLRYLPVVLIALALFIPLAILLRHVWRNDLAIEGQRLFRQLRHFGRMYGEALLPFLIVAYGFFNANLYLHSAKSKGTKKDQDQYTDTEALEVIHDNGNIMVALAQILCIEKKDRIYEVKTETNLFYVRKTLNELESLLANKGFIRINRSVLVNRTYVHNYSFWEYDKFILRMKDGTEFIVSRQRMRQIKNLLTPAT